MVVFYGFGELLCRHTEVFSTTEFTGFYKFSLFTKYTQTRLSHRVASIVQKLYDFHSRMKMLLSGFHNFFPVKKLQDVFDIRCVDLTGSYTRCPPGSLSPRCDEHLKRRSWRTFQRPAFSLLVFVFKHFQLVHVSGACNLTRQTFKS